MEERTYNTESLSSWSSDSSTPIISTVRRVQTPAAQESPVKEPDSTQNLDESVEYIGTVPAPTPRQSPESWSDSTDDYPIIIPSRVYQRPFFRRSPSPPMCSIAGCVQQIISDEEKTSEEEAKERSPERKSPDIDIGDEVESPKSILKRPLPKELRFALGESSQPKRVSLDPVVTIVHAKGNNPYNLRSKTQSEARVTRSSKK